MKSCEFKKPAAFFYSGCSDSGMRSVTPCGRDPCFPNKRMNPINPKLEDPRPVPPCPKNRDGCGCGCCPLDPPRPCECHDLKLIQLQNCYCCKVSDACKRRRSRFYDRWQQYLDRLPPVPGYDYRTYCCDNYVDLWMNKDFDRYDYARFKPLYKGQRAKAKEAFMAMHALSESIQKEECIRDECPRIKGCDEICTRENTCQDLRTLLDKQFRLYNEEPYTYWHQKILRPGGHMTGATLVKYRTKPFRKDASFSTPLYEFSTGNDPPFKQFRDLKLNM